MSGLRDEHAPLAQVRVRHSAEGAVATLTGELDMSNADEVLRELREAAGNAVGLLVDLSGLGFIDSAGIAGLDRLNRDLGSTATPFEILAPQDSVAGRTLRLAGMDRVLPITAAGADQESTG